MPAIREDHDRLGVEAGGSHAAVRLSLTQSTPRMGVLCRDRVAERENHVTNRGSAPLDALCGNRTE